MNDKPRQMQKPPKVKIPHSPKVASNIDVAAIKASKRTHERDINAGKPEHLQRRYNIKKYSSKGRGYAAQNIMSREDAVTELKRLAAKHLQLDRTITVPADNGKDRVAIKSADQLVDSFMVDESNNPKKPLPTEYRIV